METVPRPRRKRRCSAERATRRSISYARVSTDEQASSGLGLESQIERYRAYAAARGYVPVEEASDDGISGAVPPSAQPGQSP